jgi:hypothetical protein
VRVCLSVTKEWLRETKCVGVLERDRVRETETAKTDTGIVIYLQPFSPFFYIRDV